VLGFLNSSSWETIKYHSITATPVPSESIFAKAGKIMTGHQASVKPLTADMLT